MIDITPYQERLQWLQEWINIRVDSLDIRSIIDLFSETGILISINKDPLHWLPFEKYCALKERNK